jgi:DNA (cytosine-5)-methyltransferase 1
MGSFDPERGPVGENLDNRAVAREGVFAGYSSVQIVARRDVPGRLNLSKAPVLIDLFAGCGGGSMGFVRRGFRIGAAVEIDRDAASAYSLNTEVHPIRGNVRWVTGPQLLRKAGIEQGECTLLFGCPPCQGFSVMRQGSAQIPADFVRNELPNEYLRLVRSIRPRHIAFENVPGMVAGRWAPRFAALLQDLQDAGYECVWDIVDAVDFGVPQYRKRLLLIGSRVGQPRLPVATHGPGRAYPHRTVRDAIGILSALESGESDETDPLHRARRHADIAIRRLRAIPEGGARRDLPKKLQLDCHKDHNGHNDVYGRMRWDSPAPTLTSGCTNVTRGRFGHPDQARAITLREAMLLQTFPKDATLVGKEGTQALQVGNAIPTRLAEAVADIVLEMEASVRRASASKSRSAGRARETASAV